MNEPFCREVMLLGEDSRRSVPGSVSWVPPAAGMMIAGYIVRQLLGENV